MKCTVITPIGPGHSRLFDDCRRSVEQGMAHSRGPFSEIVHLAVDDTRGALGRSVARNAAVAKAVREGADWLFFLDADDVLVEDAFARVEDHVDRYDAIWGSIYELKKNATRPHIRAGQDVPIRTVDDVLRMDPALSLQMGHFVRGAVARHTRFDVRLDAGEDFDYYLRVWHRYRCLKLPHPLFMNRRGMRSKGPRSASAAAWRRLALMIIARFAEKQRMT
ncbi:MAG: glycosyltransferase [Candidatus Rokuibacteriota bacterium]